MKLSDNESGNQIILLQKRNKSWIPRVIRIPRKADQEFFQEDIIAEEITQPGPYNHRHILQDLAVNPQEDSYVAVQSSGRSMQNLRMGARVAAKATGVDIQVDGRRRVTGVTVRRRLNPFRWGVNFRQTRNS